MFRDVARTLLKKTMILLDTAKIFSPDFFKKCQIQPISQVQWQIANFILEFKSTHPNGTIFDRNRFGRIFWQLKDFCYDVSRGVLDLHLGWLWFLPCASPEGHILWCLIRPALPLQQPIKCPYTPLEERMLWTPMVINVPMAFLNATLLNETTVL